MADNIPQGIPIEANDSVDLDDKEHRDTKEDCNRKLEKERWKHIVDKPREEQQECKPNKNTIRNLLRFVEEVAPAYPP